jgi:hypothetical protein
MPTPSDLREIDEKLQRFWERYGAMVDFTIGALMLAVIAFCIGYAFGVSAR